MNIKIKSKNFLKKIQNFFFSLFKTIINFFINIYCKFLNWAIHKIIFIVPNNKAFQKEAAEFTKDKKAYNDKFHAKLEKYLVESEELFKFMDSAISKAEHNKIEIKYFKDFKQYLDSTKDKILLNIQIINFGGYDQQEYLKETGEITKNINALKKEKPQNLEKISILRKLLSLMQKQNEDNKKTCLVKGYKKIEILFAKGYAKSKNDYIEFKNSYHGISEKKSNINGQIDIYQSIAADKGMDLNYVIDDKIDELVLCARDRNNPDLDNGNRQIIIHFFGMLGMTMNHEKHVARNSHFANRTIRQNIDHVWPNFPQNNKNLISLVDYHEKIINYYLELGYKPENMILSGHCLGGGTAAETIDRFKGKKDKEGKDLKFKAFINMVSYDKISNLIPNLFNEKFSYKKFICKDYIAGDINADKILLFFKIFNLIINIIRWIFLKFISQLCKLLFNATPKSFEKKHWEMDATKIFNKDFPAEAIMIMNLCDNDNNYEDELIRPKISLIEAFKNSNTENNICTMSHPRGNNIWNHYANDEDMLCSNLMNLDWKETQPSNKLNITTTCGEENAIANNNQQFIPVH